MQNRLKSTLLAATVLAAAAVSAEAQQVGRPVRRNQPRGTSRKRRQRHRYHLGGRCDCRHPPEAGPRRGRSKSAAPAPKSRARTPAPASRLPAAVRHVEEIERLAVVSRFTNARRVLSTVSAGVAYYVPATGRWSPRLFLGVTNHRARERTELVHLSIPEGIDPERVRRAMPEQAPFIRNLGALTMGGSVGFAVTRHLSIAPDLRYDYGSIGDEINNMLRTSVRVLLVVLDAATHERPALSEAARRGTSNSPAPHVLRNPRR